MGLAAFNRMRLKYNEKMKAENVKKQQEEKQKVVETSVEYKQEEKTTLGPRKRKTDKE